MTTQEQVASLSTMTGRDEAGRHFTARYPDDVLSELEAEGLILISRPVHPRTGLTYSEENWTVEVTEKGVDLVRSYPEYQPTA
jgi:hypothetical protein